MAEGQVLTQGRTFDAVRADHRVRGPISAARGMSLLDHCRLRGGYAAADEIVKGTDLSICSGEIVALIGPTGPASRRCSSWWAGLLRPSGGSVRFKEREIAGLAGARDQPAPDFPSCRRKRNVFGTNERR